MSVQRLILTVELVDGTTYPDLRICNPAMVAFDLERASKKWPDAREAPMLWRTFIAWRQLVNQGDYTADFKTFREADCLDIDQNDDGTDHEEVDPTSPAAAPTPA